MDVVDSRFVGERSVRISHPWPVADEGVGMGMATYRDVGSADRCLEQRWPTCRDVGSADRCPAEQRWPTYGSHGVTDARGNSRSATS